MSIKKPVFFYCFFLFTIYSSAQVEKETTSAVKTVSEEEIKKLPFARGVNNFIIQQNGAYGSFKPENSDNSSRSIDLNLDYNRFLIDGFALGAELDYSSTRNEVSNTNVVKSHTVKVYGNAMYGHSFGGAVNLYGKASVGFGKSEFKSPNFPTSESDLFGYKFEIGSPIHLYNDGGNYITPFIRYDHLQVKGNDLKTTINEFSFGFQFQNYSPCSGYQCDRGRKFSGNMYEQGRSFIGYTSMGEYGFGNTEYDLLNSETDISTGSFNIEYGYYIIRDVALGARVYWFHERQENNTSKNTNSLFSFTPGLTLNAPTKDWTENFFLKTGYGFGAYKNDLGSIETKYNLSYLNIYLGFNQFFGRHLALTPRVGYEAETLKNKETDVKTKGSQFVFGFGCSLHW